MSDTEIKVPFGREGYRTMMSKIQKHFDRKTSMDHASAFLLGEIQKEMVRQGFGREQFYRAVFEDALDYATTFKIAAVVKYRREHKQVPKFLTFKVSVPRRE